MKIGSHQSASGGIDKVFERAEADECECFQMFVKSPTRWSAKPFTDAELKKFNEKALQFGPSNIVAHGAYLLNLSSLNEETAAKSKESLSDELLRCESAGIPYYVMHPGSTGGGDIKDAISLIASGIDGVYDKKDLNVRLLLENTSGGGNHLGGDLEQLVNIIDKSKHKDKLGICIDTCHAFGYGYDIINDYEQFADKLVSLFGDKLKVIHLNDSKKEFGSKLDRHEFIGQGLIGYGAFEKIVPDKRFADVLGILETPTKDDETYLKEVRLLKSYR